MSGKCELCKSDTTSHHSVMACRACFEAVQAGGFAFSASNPAEDNDLLQARLDRATGCLEKMIGVSRTQQATILDLGTEVDEHIVALDLARMKLKQAYGKMGELTVELARVMAGNDRP